MMEALRKELGPSVLENEPLSRHCTLRVGGLARYFFVAAGRTDLVRAVRAARGIGIGFVVLGGGTNALPSDAGYDGLVIKVASGVVRVEGASVYADAGVPSTLLARKAADAGLSGIEWMATLPGTVGGAVRGNAGAFGSETKDRLELVDILRGDRELTIPAAEARFGYRDSVFKHSDDIVLGATFLLDVGDRKKIEQRIKEFLDKRSDEQPLGAQSAGCIFKNYEPGSRPVEEVEEKFDAEDRTRLREFWARNRVPAGWLIEKAGMKGFCAGLACVSEKHGNFCLTTPGATADQLIQLISTVKTKVRDRLGIQLEEEVQLLGFG